MMPNEWKNQCGSLRKSYQLINAAIKTYSKFEDNEDKFSAIFKELLKFPIKNKQYQGLFP
jgi:hypothetical protein